MTSSPEEDIALARAARRGESLAAERLSQRLTCMPGVLRAMHARLGSPLHEDELAEVAQEALAALWQKLERFDGRCALETWAYGFCGTQLIQFLERKRRRDKLRYGLEADWTGVEATPEELARLEFEWVHVALDRLDPTVALVVKLKHFEELTFEEIGTRLSMSPNTAKTHYYRALERLRGALAPTWRLEKEESR
jgi:RNA polymerase sigma-70 factor, ECF subfamily